MTSTSNTLPRSYVKAAGFLYLMIIMLGISGEGVIRSALIVNGDASATATNILASPSLFSFGFVANSFMVLADVALALVFFYLLRPVSPLLSASAAVFRLMQAAMLGVTLLLYYAASLLINGAGYLSSLSDQQLYSLSSFFLDLYGHGYDLGLIFFAVSNFFLGYLLIKSGFIPKPLGYGLLAASVVYLLGSYTRFLAAEYLHVVEPFYLIPLVAELSLCVWLLINGFAKERSLNTGAARV